MTDEVESSRVIANAQRKAPMPPGSLWMDIDTGRVESTEKRPPSGAHLKERGQSDSATHWVMPAVRRELKYLYSSDRPFSTDDLWNRFSPTLKDAVTLAVDVVGAAITEAAKAGLIEMCGSVRTTRPEGRSRWIKQWKRRAP